MSKATYHQRRVVALEPAALTKAAKAFPTAAGAALFLGVRTSSFRRACGRAGITWRTEGNHTDVVYDIDLQSQVSNYINTCTTPGCGGFPLRRGRCVRCESKRRMVA